LRRRQRYTLLVYSNAAEAERDRIRERIAEVKRDQRARGRHLGGTRPFGFKKVFTPPRGFDLVPVPEDAKPKRAAAKSGEAGAT
jgi:DNA invertase Pin-like site-specific DNA recombinase